MKTLKEFINSTVNEDRISGKTIYPGDKIICKNPVFPDKPDWELTYVDKDGKNFRGINLYGQTVTVPQDKVVEIIRIAEAPKRKMSAEQQRKVRRQIRELEDQLDDLRVDMENDPDVLDEQGAGGKATDKYGKAMGKIYDKIDALYKKLDEAA